MDATTREIVRILRRLRPLAERDPIACLGNLPVWEMEPAVYQAATSALRRTGFYLRKRIPARVRAVDRAIESLEAKP